VAATAQPIRPHRTSGSAGRGSAHRSASHRSRRYGPGVSPVLCRPGYGALEIIPGYPPAFEAAIGVPFGLTFAVPRRNVVAGASCAREHQVRAIPHGRAPVAGSRTRREGGGVSAALPLLPKGLRQLDAAMWIAAWRCPFAQGERDASNLTLRPRAQHPATHPEA
jgi:hypothetical protein